MANKRLNQSGSDRQKSWQARIGTAQDALAVQFVESLSFDFRLAKHDILGSIAHATMLESVGLLTKKDLAAIKSGLLSILQDIEANGGKPGGKFSPDIEDVKAIAIPILRHRLVLNYKAEAEGMSVEEIVKQLL